MYEHVGTGEIKVSNVFLTDSNGERKTAFQTAQDIEVNINYKVSKTLDKANFGVSIFRNDGVCCYGISTQKDGMGFLH